MTNPDIKNQTSANTMSIAFAAATIIFIVVLVLFQFKPLITSFKTTLWIAIPLISYIIAVAIHFISQYITCSSINSRNAFLGGVSTLITTLLGLGISSISWCRIPIASAFAPLFTGDVVDITKNGSTNTNSLLRNTNSKNQCCTPKFTLESIENTFPLLLGLSYGFYTFFSIIFGIIIGNGIAVVC